MIDGWSFLGVQVSISGSVMSARAFYANEKDCSNVYISPVVRV